MSVAHVWLVFMADSHGSFIFLTLCSHSYVKVFGYSTIILHANNLRLCHTVTPHNYTYRMYLMTKPHSHTSRCTIYD